MSNNNFCIYLLHTRIYYFADAAEAFQWSISEEICSQFTGLTIPPRRAGGGSTSRLSVSQAYTLAFLRPSSPHPEIEGKPKKNNILEFMRKPLLHRKNTPEDVFVAYSARDVMLREMRAGKLQFCTYHILCAVFFSQFYKKVISRFSFCAIKTHTHNLCFCRDRT